jgi:hypothetical protein
MVDRLFSDSIGTSNNVMAIDMTLVIFSMTLVNIQMLRF